MSNRRRLSSRGLITFLLFGCGGQSWDDPELTHLGSSTSSVIYWTDERKDRYEISNANHLSRFTSVGKLVSSSRLIDQGGGYVRLVTESATLSTMSGLGLCSNEKFASQPVYEPTERCNCTGIGCLPCGGEVINTNCTVVLVAPTIVATAGHCGGDRVLFNFHMNSSTNAKSTFFGPDEVYSATYIVGGGSGSNNSDWNLFRLDRAAHSSLTIVPMRSSGTISGGASIYNISHSLGMPSKFVDDTVVENSNSERFASHLQVFRGSSGSPVFNASTHVLEGLVTGGPKYDLASTDTGCMSYSYCLWGDGDPGSDACRAVRVVRTSMFRAAVLQNSP